MFGFADKCPQGMVSYQKVCLEINTEKKSWSDARIHCNLNGGDLVKITGEDLRKGYFIEGKSAIEETSEYSIENVLVVIGLKCKTQFFHDKRQILESQQLVSTRRD